MDTTLLIFGISILVVIVAIVIVVVLYYSSKDNFSPYNIESHLKRLVHSLESIPPNQRAAISLGLAAEIKNHAGLSKKLLVLIYNNLPNLPSRPGPVKPSPHHPPIDHIPHRPTPEKPHPYPIPPIDHIPHRPVPEKPSPHHPPSPGQITAVVDQIAYYVQGLSREEKVQLIQALVQISQRSPDKFVRLLALVILFYVQSHRPDMPSPYPAPLPDQLPSPNMPSPYPAPLPDQIPSPDMPSPYPAPLPDQIPSPDMPSPYPAPLPDQIPSPDMPSPYPVPPSKPSCPSCPACPSLPDLSGLQKPCCNEDKVYNINFS